MLIRLLQAFSSIKLDVAAIPQDKIPPVFEDLGRKEKVWVKSHLTVSDNALQIVRKGPNSLDLNHWLTDVRGRKLISACPRSL